MHELWLTFKNARSSYKASIKQAKRHFLSKQASDCGRDSKKLYALVFSLTGTIQYIHYQNVTVLTLLQETLCISSTQRSGISGITWIITQSTHHSIRISQYGYEVLWIIKNMPTKQCKLDPIPTSLFKQLVPYIINECTAIFNISLTRGDFTEELKTVCIKLPIKRSPWN